MPELRPAPEISALVGKPIRRVEVVSVGKRFRAIATVETVRPGEPFGPEAARRAMRELGQTGKFARLTAEAIAENGGVVLRLSVMPRRIVSSIQLAGATLERNATLEAARIHDGSEITEPMITEITERVRRYYADHGHPKAKVTADISDTDVADHVVLRLDIDAGTPLTITRRFFNVTKPMAEEVGDLNGRYRLGIGARLDEPLLDEADRDLVDSLRESGFLRASVSHSVRLSDKGSDLVVYVDPGPRIVPIFEGNTSIDSVELLVALKQEKGLELKTQDVLDKLVRYYVERGFLDVTVKAEERGGPNDPVHHIVLTINEGSRVRVVRRAFPCLPKSWDAGKIGQEIDSFLVEDLPGEKGFSLRDPNAVSSLFAPHTSTRPVAKPLDLNPTNTYAPETYERALKHLRDLAHSRGYLHAAIGPVSIDRATCDPRSPADRCIPLPNPKIEARCALDAQGLPAAEPDPPTALTCKPDPVKHIECAREVSLRIPMHLGPQTILYDVAFEGGRVFSEKQLFDHAQLGLGDPLSTIALEAARLRLLEAYRNRGYAYAEVAATIEPSPDRTRARARFAITERDQVIIGGFVIRGASRTSQELILRRLTLAAGKPYIEREARTSEQRVGALGTFSSVAVALEDPEVPQKQKRVIITVTEQVTQYLDPRVGFSTGEGLRFAVEYGHRNIGGLAIALTLRVQLSYLFDFIVLDPGVRADYERLSVAQQLERRNTVSIAFPEIGLGPLVSFSIDGIDIRDNQRGFGISRQAIVPTLAYRPLRSTTVRIGASAEVNEVDVFNEKAIDSPIIPLLRVPRGSTVALAERVNFAWDGRNNAFAATQGALVALGAEHVNAVPIDTSNATINSHFLRLSGRVAGYFELGSKGGPSIAMSMAAGYNWQLDDASETYPDRLFFLGGVDTIRAFLADALVPEDVARGLVEQGQTTRSAVLANVPIRGGDLSLNPRLELRVPLNDTFQTGFFLDTGNLWKEPSAIDFTLRYALGAGLRILTPVGPVALDYGINLNRRQWEDFGAFHFSIGLF